MKTTRTLVPVVALLFALAARAEPIHDAASAGNLGTVRELLTKNPASANARDGYGSTPLHEAAAEGHREVVLLLLHNGADVNAKNSSGRTPLVGATHRGQAVIVEILLANKADPKVRIESGSTLLHIAAFRGYPRLVQLFLTHGLDANVTDNLATTPLHAAASGDNANTNAILDVVIQLLDAGARVNAKDVGGRTPLDVALREGHREIAVLLKSRGGRSSISDDR